MTVKTKSCNAFGFEVQQWERALFPMLHDLEVLTAAQVIPRLTKENNGIFIMAKP